MIELDSIILPLSDALLLMDITFQSFPWQTNKKPL
jgi:hypothetical protein